MRYRLPAAAGRTIAGPVLSSLPVNTVLPSGLKAMAQTGPCVSGGPRGWPVATDHSRAVVSPLPVNTLWLSAPKATARTDA